MGKENDIDLNTHLSLITGLERRTIKAMRFLYGTSENRDELIKAHGKAAVLKMTLDFLAQFPATAQDIRFRKERSRLMLRALVEKVVTRRNTTVTYDGIHFWFTYRGNVVLAWDVSKDEIRDVFVEKYNDAPSTVYQRTIAREAIHEFRKVILNT